MANLAALAAARQTKYDSLGRLRMYASKRDAFFHRQGGGASGNWRAERAARRRSTNASECG
jgi:hypothetical protein